MQLDPILINEINSIFYLCEHLSIYDKLSKYGDFYYKLKKYTKNPDEHVNEIISALENFISYCNDNEDVKHMYFNTYQKVDLLLSLQKSLK